MSAESHPVPEPLDVLQRRAFAAGAAGLIASLIGALVSPTQFFRSYLFAFLFWNGIALGCLSLLMIQHLTGGRWGLAIRRLLEAGTRTVPVLALLFLPVVLGLKRIYPWAGSEQTDAIMRHAIEAKHAYLNVPFFLGRAAFYFAVWFLLAYFLSRVSLESDAGMDLRQAAEAAQPLRRRPPAHGPHHHVHVRGLGHVPRPALVLHDLRHALHDRDGPLRARPLHRGGHAHRWARAPRAWSPTRTPSTTSGKLMLAFIMVWAYFSYSQFLIIWSGNLPEEIPWYLRRYHGVWRAIGLFLVLFHFVVPFLVLLSRGVKRRAKTVGMVALWILAVRARRPLLARAARVPAHGLRPALARSHRCPSASAACGSGFSRSSSRRARSSRWASPRCGRSWRRPRA